MVTLKVAAGQRATRLTAPFVRKGVDARCVAATTANAWTRTMRKKEALDATSDTTNNISEELRRLL